MSVIIILIIISVIVAVFFLGIFIWAVKSGQFDDTVSPSIRMLFENDKKESKNDQKRTKEKGKEWLSAMTDILMQTLDLQVLFPNLSSH